MLARSDTEIPKIIGDLAAYGVVGSFLVPTETALTKSIMDAHEGLRTFLSERGVHDFSSQQLGPEHKRVLEGQLLSEGGWKPIKVSLYRPLTKTGDPRIWFSRLNDYADAFNLLVCLVWDQTIYVINASNLELWESRKLSGSPLNRLLLSMGESARGIESELLTLLGKIHRRGFVPSTTNADNGVGDTLEDLLGIQRNSNRNPDYKGIEIKSARTLPNGRQVNRSNLFALAPDWKSSKLKNSRQIVDKYGYLSLSSGRRALQVTLNNKPNQQGLFLMVEHSEELVANSAQTDQIITPVVQWKLRDLEKSLDEKHRATFWVKALTRIDNGLEYFHYSKVLITSAPLTANFSYLVDAGIIQMDYTISEKIRPSGALYMRDHGYLWKIRPTNLASLFPSPRLVDLACIE